MQKLLIFFGLFLISLGLNSAGAETIVDSEGRGDYTTIEEALQFAVEDDTIFVWDGNYSGHFSIDISNIELVGNGSSKTIIQGNDTGLHNIVIDADNVTISDFMITGGDWAIYMTDSVNSQFLRNNITGNNRGIGLFGSGSYNIFEENIIIDNVNNGILLKSSDRSNYTVYSNIIKDNIISETNIGISLEGTSNTEVSNNVIQEFGLYGILTTLSMNDFIVNNTITNGNYGIFLANSHSLTITKNSIFSLEGYGIWSNGGQLMITDYNESLYFGKHLIDDNEIHSCSAGVRISGSMNNRIVNNKIYNHNYYGLEVVGSSDNTTVINNTVSFNSEIGLYIFMSSSIEIASNQFSENSYGIFVRSSSGNYIHSNFLLNNNIGIYLNNVSYSNLINMNNISTNIDYGVYSEIEVNATSNYWGDPSGPYNQLNNPLGLGDNVSDNVIWFVETDSSDMTISSTSSSFFSDLPIGTLGIFVGVFAVTNYVVSGWVVKELSKSFKVPVDKIGKWMKKEQEKSKKQKKE